ncbi:hypothetical protein [Hyphobacterium sp.]|uniref:hypothetical protein n=1 Tax=Hyphobacterium sp. TaxID=2004662 RepID=UPI003BAD459D
MAKRKSAQPADLVSLQVCADRLTKSGDEITRSGLSRYVADYPSLVKGKGARGAKLVNFEEVQQHRMANDDRAAKSGKEIQAKPDAAADAAGKIEDLEGRRRERNAKAALAELELADKLGLVVERAEVEAGMAMIAGRTARQSEHEARDVAEQLAVDLKLTAADAAAVRVALKQFARRTREIQSEELKRFAGQLGDGEASEDAVARLERLIEIARSDTDAMQTFKAAAKG